jgi:hypothetical protein
MQPIYVTQTSSGSSPRKTINWHVTPIHIGLAARTNGLSSNWQIDVTMDDPSNVYPSSAGPTVFPSPAVGGPAITSSNAIGAILQPIAAWRLTVSSTGGSVTVSALQAGIG